MLKVNYYLILALMLSTLYLAHAQSTFTLDEVSKHNNESSCWFVINDSVYDVTDYISSHDNKLNIRPWCGKDATQDYLTKAGRGESHSRRADRDLESLVIGTLKTESSTQVNKQELPKSIKIAATTSKVKSYNVLLPLSLTVILYFASLKIFTRQTHNLVWNTVMLLGLVPSLVFGMLMALSSQYVIFDSLIFKDMLYYHVEFSIVFGVVCVLHLLLRKNSYIAQAKFFAKKTIKK